MAGAAKGRTRLVKTSHSNLGRRRADSAPGAILETDGPASGPGPVVVIAKEETEVARRHDGKEEEEVARQREAQHTAASSLRTLRQARASPAWYHAQTSRQRCACQAHREEEDELAAEAARQCQEEEFTAAVARNSEHRSALELVGAARARTGVAWYRTQVCRILAMLSRVKNQVFWTSGTLDDAPFVCGYSAD